jgi:hypothetical protein
VLMFLGMILVFLAKHHGDHMKCSAWWRWDRKLFLPNEVSVVPHTFFSMSLHTSMYSAVTTTISGLSCEGYRFAGVSSPSLWLSQTHCGCLAPATLLAGSVGSCLSSYPGTLHSDFIMTWPASS